MIIVLRILFLHLIEKKKKIRLEDYFLLSSKALWYILCGRYETRLVLSSFISCLSFLEAWEDGLWQLTPQ